MDELHRSGTIENASRSFTEHLLDFMSTLGTRNLSTPPKKKNPNKLEVLNFIVQTQSTCTDIFASF